MQRLRQTGSGGPGELPPCSCLRARRLATRKNIAAQTPRLTETAGAAGNCSHTRRRDDAWRLKRWSRINIYRLIDAYQGRDHGPGCKPSSPPPHTHSQFIIFFWGTTFKYLGEYWRAVVSLPTPILLVSFFPTPKVHHIFCQAQRGYTNTGKN